MDVNKLKSLIRELIKTELEEASTTGTGASFQAGNSEAFATPHAFGDNKKKKKRGYLGYKEVK
jgi:hypothetical protein